jgi:hypothetical protein
MPVAFVEHPKNELIRRVFEGGRLRQAPIFFCVFKEENAPINEAKRAKFEE